jgi:hypothetical protein
MRTNLTEIDLALDLLWRNDIKKDMVVMGLAFYGRAYTVNPACTTPGCLYLSGGLKGECSREVGVLLNDEIDQILDMKCVGFCTHGKVKVAMDIYNLGCYSRGYGTFCCEPSVYTETTRYSDEVLNFQKAAQSWADNPTCAVGNSGPAQRSTTADLVVRGTVDSSAVVRQFLLQMGSKCDVWGTVVQQKGWLHLECDTLYNNWVNSSFHEPYLVQYGSFNITNSLTCDPALWEAVLEDDGEDDIICDDDICQDDASLCNEEGFDSDYLGDVSTETLRRRTQWVEKVPHFLVPIPIILIEHVSPDIDECSLLIGKEDKQAAGQIFVR